MSELTDARRPIIPALPLPHTQPKAPERSFLHWTMAVSAVLHAAVITLVISLHFSGPRQATVSAPFSAPEKKIEQPTELPRAMPSEALIATVRGEVHNLRNDKIEIAVNGIPLDENDAVETVGTNSSADIRYLDGTRVELKPDSRMRRVIPQEAYAGSKCIYLEHGSLAANVSPQSRETPMRLITPNAEVTVVGTEFTLASYPGQTQLDVTEGTVRLTRIADGRSVEVHAGEFAIVAEGVELSVRPRGSRRFVKGINFFGPAVKIDGMLWMSHEQALRDGMQLQYNLRGTNANLVNYSPVPKVEESTRKMLMSRVYSIDDNVGIQVPLIDGAYEIEMWVFETHKPFSRSFDVEVNGVMVQRGVGKMPLYNWVKAGPYRADVSGGKLDIRIHKVSGNPVISGLCIHALDSKNDSKQD
jgi:hypothetical protein